MFTLPSLPNLIVSLLAFFAATRYLNLHLDRREIARTGRRGMLVFIFASLLSWGAGEMTDWTAAKISGPLPSASPDIQTLKDR